MYTAKTNIAQPLNFLQQKYQDYSLLVKMRLSMTVVFSAVIAFAIATAASIDIAGLLWLFAGGFLITGSSNALNEIFEKDYDRHMKRTANRPLATGRMSVSEALLAAGIMGIGGILILWLVFNPYAAILGALSLILYAFIYTPLKRFSPIAVFVGAFPGAMPVLIGWVAATGGFSFEAYVLFSVQFLWQFPHFWAIGWMAHDDYKQAGFKLLPSTGGRDKFTAFQCIVYVSMLIPVSLLAAWLGNLGVISYVVIGLAGALFLWKAIHLFKTQDVADARKLMLTSIMYLPIVLLTLLIGRVL